MSRIRDIANILSANTAMATDAEVSSAVSSAVSTHATAANGHVGRGTTAQRPTSASIGDTYFDTTLSQLLSFKSTGWEKVSQDPAPGVSSISPTTAAVTGTSISITGSNFKAGLSVQFVGTNFSTYNSPSVTFLSASSVSATTPSLPVAFEPYDVKVINSDNQFGTLENCLDVGGTPVWNTASGTIATIYEQTALNVSVSATDPDGTSIVYSSTNLPVATPTPVTFQVTNSGSGAYLMNGVSNGTITLTRGGTYTFNVNASGHPFYIQTTGNGYNSYNVYSTGVTGAGAQVGTVTFTVPSNAPDTLYYQCQYHSAMYGQINIVSASPWITLNSSTGSLTGTAPDVASDTTYTFDITASDGVNLSSRSFSVVVSAIVIFNVDYLLVGGGGGSGYRADNVYYLGGGGGGGLRSSVGSNGGGAAAESPLTLTNGITYNISVGMGGPGTAYGQLSSANNGGNSSISGTGITTITALGGGAGANPDNAGFNGGSGGGAGGNDTTRSGGTALTPTQGYAGGNVVNNNNAGGGGGGGGAGGPGGNVSSGNIKGGTGGSALQNSITGVSVYYAGGGPGGGGYFSSPPGNPQLGSFGTGYNRSNPGMGGYMTVGEQAVNSGTAGVVIIRSPRPAVNVTGTVLVTSVGSDTVYQFNTNGTVTF